MATQTIERIVPLIAEKTNGTTHEQRHLKTQINHADQVAYMKELEPFGGKEQLWQGGDIYYPNPPKVAIDVTVHDLSGRENEFTLEKNGFAVLKQHSEVMKVTDDLRDGDKIKNEYYPEMEKWLKEVTGAPRVKVIHHGCRISTSKVRVNDFKKDVTPKNDDAPKKNVINPGPGVFAAHLDQSSWQGGNVIHSHFPEECETLMHGRYMIVNAWRPIKTVYKHPFGVADATTVPSKDLVVRANRWYKEIKESMGIIANPQHQWYYKFAQKPEEVLLFKQFDNHGKARACPHSAFIDPEYEDSYPRESIEVRAILLWPNDESVLA